jgi:predicted TIM-barrel fold metal-dependent hydrolase
MRLIDMDTHYAPPDEFAYVAEEFKYFTPGWLPQGQGRVAMTTPNWPKPPRMAGLMLPHKRFAGDFDVDSRLKDMDRMEVEKQLLNPEFGQYSYDTDPRLMAEMCRSANLAIGKAIKAHPDRFIGSAVLPTQNMKATLEEAERCLDAGFQTFFLKAAQGGQGYENQYFWPLWDLANDQNVAISVHANTRDWGGVVDANRMGGSWGFFVGTLAEYCAISCGMIYAGVFDVFPNLRFCLAEAGATWLLWLWDRLVLTYDVDMNSHEKCKQHPTEYLKENIYATVDPTEESLGHLCQRFPPKNLMLGTDYPHGDITGRGRAADKVGALRTTHIDLLLEREDISEEAKEDIAYRNALTFLGGRVN